MVIDRWEKKVNNSRKGLRFGSLKCDWFRPGHFQVRANVKLSGKFFRGVSSEQLVLPEYQLYYRSMKLHDGTIEREREREKERRFSRMNGYTCIWKVQPDVVTKVVKRVISTNGRQAIDQWVIIEWRESEIFAMKCCYVKVILHLPRSFSTIKWSAAIAGSVCLFGWNFKWSRSPSTDPKWFNLISMAKISLWMWQICFSIVVVLLVVVSLP